MKANIKTFPTIIWKGGTDSAIEMTEWKEDFEKELREMECANNNAGEFFSLRLQELIKEVLGE